MIKNYYDSITFHERFSRLFTTFKIHEIAFAINNALFVIVAFKYEHRVIENTTISDKLILLL